MSHSSVISASMASGGGPPWSRSSCRITGSDSGIARTIELARCSASVGTANSPVLKPRAPRSRSAAAGSGPSYVNDTGAPSWTRRMLSSTWGRATRRSLSIGPSARARTRSSRSTVRDTKDSSHTGARPRTSPPGPTRCDVPKKRLPPSEPTRFTKLVYTPCSSAMSRTSRSQRAALYGPAMPSSRGQMPRAGAADDTNTTWAPSRAAMVPLMECQASSHTRMAARPHGVSNARISVPRSTKRSSSKSP